MIFIGEEEHKVIITEAVTCRERSEAGNHRACSGTANRRVWLEQRPRTGSPEVNVKAKPQCSFPYTTI